MSRLTYFTGIRGYGLKRTGQIKEKGTIFTYIAMEGKNADFDTEVRRGYQDW